MICIFSAALKALWMHPMYGVCTAVTLLGQCLEVSCLKTHLKMQIKLNFGFHFLLPIIPSTSSWLWKTFFKVLESQTYLISSSHQTFISANSDEPPERATTQPLSLKVFILQFRYFNLSITKPTVWDCWKILVDHSQAILSIRTRG